MRQQFFYEDRLKDLANDRREANGSELPWLCCAGGFLRQGLLLRGANLQGPGQFVALGQCGS